MIKRLCQHVWAQISNDKVKCVKCHVTSAPVYKTNFGRTMKGYL